MVSPVGVPFATLKRLPLYLKLIKEASARGLGWVSSEELAQRLGLGAIQVRKDLSGLGLVGSPRRGFPVEDAARAIAACLGGDNSSDVFLVGAGELGRAVLADRSIGLQGFKLVAVFDRTPERYYGLGLDVMPLAKMGPLAARMSVRMAVLAAGQDWAQEGADAIVAAGLSAALDMSGLPAVFPHEIAVARVNLGADLAYLAGRLCPVRAEAG